MRLLPFPSETDEGIQQALKEAGLLKPEKERTAAQNRREEFGSHLETHNAGLEDVAKSLSSALRDPEKNVQAARLILESQGLTKENSGSTLPSIVIQILDPGSRNNIADLVRPI